jgi:predicted O-methyltransferase YrrM
MGATRVLELGSGFGYSAFFFAQAVGEGGEVILTELSHENADQARDFLDRAELGDRVRVLVGDGIKLSREMFGHFDIVFNDAEKEDYPAALSVARALLRPGGLFICDNMLWYGRVLEQDTTDKDTRGVIELTRQLAAAEDFVTSLISIRDGVTVSVRVQGSGVRER